MKKDLLIVPTYIAVTLFFTCLLAVFFVLYPIPYIGTMDFSTYVLDVFLYTMLFLLPLIAVFTLVIIVLRSIKYNATSMLSFLSYVFLCLSVWLILIPLFLFLTPERTVSQLITGNTTYIASIFFNVEYFPLLAENLLAYKINLSNSVLSIFSDLLLLREQALSSGEQGRISYLIFASLGLALSSLYGLRFVSKWNLINVATILFFWCIIVLMNALMYKNGWELYVGTSWTVFIINSIAAIIFILIGCVTGVKYKKSNKEVK